MNQQKGSISDNQHWHFMGDITQIQKPCQEKIVSFNSVILSMKLLRSGNEAGITVNGGLTHEET